MARSVTFGGQTQFKPGGLTRVNANALAPVGLTQTGIIGLIGEADGGYANTVTQIDDPALAKSLFRSGPLADAIKIAFASSNDPRIPGGAFRVLAYKTNQGVVGDTEVPDETRRKSDVVKASPAPTTTVFTLVTGGLTVDAEIDRWVQVNGEVRRIVDNTADTLTVSPGFTKTPANPDAVYILAKSFDIEAKEEGAATNQIGIEIEDGNVQGKIITISQGDAVETSPDVGGTPQLYIKYVGGPIVATGDITVCTTSIVTLNVASAPTLNQYAGMYIQLDGGLQRKILSNTAADPAEITLATGHYLTSAQAAALVGTNASVRNATSAVAKITGASGVATGLSTTVLPTADDLTLSFSTIGTAITVKQLVDYLNGNTNYEATVPAGLSPDTLMSSFDFDYSTDVRTQQSVAYDNAIAPTTEGVYKRDLQAIVDWINDYSELARAYRASEDVKDGSYPPVNTVNSTFTFPSVPVYFTGGARGISINQNFQNGFDEMVKYRMNHIVPLISADLGSGQADVATVMAQLGAHVALARTMGKNEQGGYMGVDATLTELVTYAAGLNEGDVQLFGQKMSFVDVDGNLEEMDEWATAVAAASMRAGTAEVGEPLTFKYVKTSTLTQDASWDPKSRTDVNKLIAGGVMFAETVAGGIRWVRDLTTYVKDDNIAFMDGNTREAVRYIAYDLRTSLEDAFTGLKATPATVSSMRSFVVTKMNNYLEQNIIVTSLDPETRSTNVPGWRNLRVFIEGNVATVRIEVFPCTGVVFELNDIYLQLPILAA